MRGKLALISGATGGLGRAIAERFASEGARLALLYGENREAAAELCSLCREKYQAEAEAFSCEVSDFTGVKETVSVIKKQLGAVQILVNNAGITKDSVLPLMKEEDFDRVISVNLKGAFNLIRHCSAFFIRNKWGRIINISSVAGMIGNGGQANYAAAKAGLLGLTKSVAKELADRQITCNAIAPGYIQTRLTAGFEEKSLAKSIPVGRFGRPEEVAALAAFLASEEASYLTGTVIPVDGGLAM